MSARSNRELANVSNEVPFGEVLVPIGGPVSALRAVAHAGKLAQATDLPLRWIDVDDDSEHAQAVRRRTKVLHPNIRAEDIQIIGGDDPVTALTGRVHADSLLCMATDHAGDTDHHRSVATDLLRATGATAVLVGPNVKRAIGEAAIAVGIEGTPGDADAMRVARALGHALGQRLWLVHVVVPAEQRMNAELNQRGHQVHESFDVRSLADELGHEVVAGWEVIHAADAPSGLVSFAADDRCSAVVCRSYVGSVPESGAAASTALAVAHDAPCPVVIVQEL